MGVTGCANYVVAAVFAPLTICVGIASTIGALALLLQHLLRFIGLLNAVCQHSGKDGPSPNNLEVAKVKQLHLVSFLFSDIVV